MVTADADMRREPQVRGGGQATRPTELARAGEMMAENLAGADMPGGRPQRAAPTAIGRH